MISRRTQWIVLGVLVFALGWVVAARWGRAPELGSVLFANEKYEPLAIPDPTLRLDLLERVRNFEYKGTGRNIFSASLPPRPQPAPPPQPAPVVAPTSSEPPPLQVPFRFYGYKEDPRTGHRRAFFTDGENVFIAAQGETIQNRFRLLKIGNQSAEVEEISSGRRTTLQLEQPPQ
jgi:hypothetical protein